MSFLIDGREKWLEEGLALSLVENLIGGLLSEPGPRDKLESLRKLRFGWTWFGICCCSGLLYCCFAALEVGEAGFVTLLQGLFERLVVWGRAVPRRWVDC
eukprot:TRINITY_DN9652_c0_g1_i3.p3 TRINITY_DN9652_c0_g1~~TRINITY_DN9652_c0_g1_i3.p3  ORF type:complete len:100 (+),score=19.38 TRINITY_DN9652_c0_g1_i3:70-369(+)